MAKAHCSVHKHVEMVTFCPACRGGVTSKRKAASSRENGKLGGRPPKTASARKTRPAKTTRVRVRSSRATA